MFIREIIAELHDELALLEQVINSLERLSPAEMMGSVHPPAWREGALITSHRPAAKTCQSGSTSLVGLAQPAA